MTIEEALNSLKEEFGELKQRELADGLVLVVVGPLSIGGGSQKTKLALKLPKLIESVPEVFVETHVTLNSGGQPANVTNVDIEGDSWKKWSFKTEWKPSTHIINQLVYAVLSIFNR